MSHAALTLPQKIGQLLMVGFDGLEPDLHVEQVLRDLHAGGVILFRRNVANPRQLAALTRARIKTRLSRKFWSSVPPVTQSRHAQPGLIGAIGIGEAPVGLQGTFSVWRSSTAVRDFAYRSAPHLEAIPRTDETNWYAEELFARFAIISSTGELGVSSR